MYRITCDGHPLLDARDEDYILGNPRVKNEVNTVGEGSFKIYFNHPNFNQLIPLRSIFEVADEYGVIFRGRMTEDTKDFDNGKDVDLEGAMSYFNDSIIRPYVFPTDFEENAEYQAAAAESPEQAAIDGGVVRFLLKWYIDRHNEQVEPFQRFKLGRVTVYDKNNYIERADSNYPSAWKELSDKLFNSSLGGYLCIRYEADGNYIDYLREFTEVNEQGITYGENMLDITKNADASTTYSAIIPLGAESSQSNGEVYEGMYGDIVGGSTSKLTIKGLPDGNITNDIVKKGDTLYSKSAVAAYGWRYAPIDETTWDDVKEPANLQAKGVEFLSGDSTKIPNTIKVMAVDMNCTDAQIRSFRIYKKIPVYTPAHGINDTFDLTALDIDLLNPQNTKITVGKTVMTMTDYQANQQANFQKILGSYATTHQVSAGFKHTETLIEKSIESIDLSAYAKASDVNGAFQEVNAQLSLAVFTDENGNLDSKIHIGANKLTIDTNNFTLSEDGDVTISGKITALADSVIGGWNISKTAITKTVTHDNVDYTVMLNTLLHENNPHLTVAFGVHTTSADGEWPFYVRPTGELYATKAHIGGESTFSGILQVIDGDIAGWHITADKLISPYYDVEWKDEILPYRTMFDKENLIIDRAGSPINTRWDDIADLVSMTTGKVTPVDGRHAIQLTNGGTLIIVVSNGIISELYTA